MSELYTQARQFRGQLIARDTAAASDLTAAYGQIWADLEERLLALGQEIEAARERGEEVTPGWLIRQQRYRELQQQAEEQLREFADYASERVQQEQARAVEAARRQSVELIDAAYADAPTEVRAAVNFNRLPTGAVEDLVGFASNGTPLRKLFDELGSSASAAIRRELIVGIGTGRNPKETAREIREELGGDLVRARRIARTETLRAYRESTRRTYEANADVVKGWRWTCAKQRRTCACCLAMDGQEFPNSETLEAHPNCRCTAVPVTKSWAELGFPDVPEPKRNRQNGEAWLRSQPEDVQRSVLGDRAYKAFAAGEVTLKDFVAVRHSDEWGTTRSTAGLKAAKRNAAERTTAERKRGEAATQKVVAGTAAIGLTVMSGEGDGDSHPPKRTAPHSTAEWATKVRQARQGWLESTARSAGLTPERYEEQANQHIARLLAETQPFARIHFENMDALLDTGQFLTQFETGTSGGEYAPLKRRLAEKTYWGYAEDTAPRERPVYGYFHTDPNGQKVGAIDHLKRYGDVSVRLKPEVLERTSFTGGDSLQQNQEDRLHKVAPTPYGEPRWTAVGPNLGDVTRFRNAETLLRSVENERESLFYLEAQFHHGVTVDDIAEMVFTRKPPPPELEAKLAERGISWRVVKSR